MTEKVKITKEQAAAIERYKKELIDSIDEQYRFGVKRTPYEWAEPLVELGGEQVLNTLRNGYELEPEFELGDWVTDVSNGSITKLVSKEFVEDLNNGFWTSCRHATPEEIAEEKQRRWWEKHGREVWELKKGDILKYLYNGEMVLSEANNILNKSVRNSYKIACFAEDRKDLEGQA